MHPFRPVLSASSGCPAAINRRILSICDRQQSEMLYNLENTLFYQVDQMLVENDLYTFLAMLGKFILPGSALYLNKSILNISSDTEYQVDHPEETPHSRALSLTIYGISDFSACYET